MLPANPKPPRLRRLRRLRRLGPSWFWEVSTESFCSEQLQHTEAAEQSKNRPGEEEVGLALAPQGSAPRIASRSEKNIGSVWRQGCQVLMSLCCGDCYSAATTTATITAITSI